MKKPIIISVSIHKGGSGKSSVCSNLAFALAQLGYKVLAVDTDSQMNLSHSYDLYSNEKNFYRAFVHKEDIREHIIETKYKNIDFVVGDVALANIEKKMHSMDFRELRAREIFEPMIEEGSEYDFILIDQNPSLGMLNTSLLHASDEVLIPIEPSAFGIEGLDVFLEHYNSVKAYHKDLNILGIVFNKVDRRENLSQDTLYVVESVFGHHLLETQILVDSNIKNAQWAHEPLAVYNKNSRAVKNFNNLAKEVVSIVSSR